MRIMKTAFKGISKIKHTSDKWREQFLPHHLSGAFPVLHVWEAVTFHLLYLFSWSL